MPNLTRNNDWAGEGDSGAGEPDSVSRPDSGYEGELGGEITSLPRPGKPFIPPDDYPITPDVDLPHTCDPCEAGFIPDVKEWSNCFNYSATVVNNVWTQIIEQIFIAIEEAVLTINEIYNDVNEWIITTINLVTNNIIEIYNQTYLNIANIITEINESIAYFNQTINYNFPQGTPQPGPYPIPPRPPGPIPEPIQPIPIPIPPPPKPPQPESEICEKPSDTQWTETECGLEFMKEVLGAWGPARAFGTDSRTMYELANVALDGVDGPIYGSND